MLRSLLFSALLLLTNIAIAIGQQPTIDESTLDGLIAIDADGYGHINFATLHTLEINLLTEQKITGRLITISTDTFVGVPRIPCSVWNGCEDVALYMVENNPKLAQKGLNLTRRGPLKPLPAKPLAVVPRPAHKVPIAALGVPDNKVKTILLIGAFLIVLSGVISSVLTSLLIHRRIDADLETAEPVCNNRFLTPGSWPKPLMEPTPEMKVYRHLGKK